MLYRRCHQDRLLTTRSMRVHEFGYINNLVLARVSSRESARHLVIQVSLRASDSSCRQMAIVYRHFHGGPLKWRDWSVVCVLHGRVSARMCEYGVHVFQLRGGTERRQTSINCRLRRLMRVLGLPLCAESSIHRYTSRCSDDSELRMHGV